jgi:hypothetical protein
LEAFEFIRRFLLHVLPDQFVKIRYYGILSHRNRKKKLLRCKKLLGVLIPEESKEGPKESWQDLLTRITGIDPRVCPYCAKGKMSRGKPCHLLRYAWQMIYHHTPAVLPERLSLREATPLTRRPYNDSSKET